MRKIAIVEDDREISRQLEEFLENNGYDCMTVTDYDDAAEQIAQGGADMVLLDLTLPGADGAGILRTLRKSSDIPVIIVTSKNTEMDEVICMSYGADDFIAKPYNPAILLLHIEAVFKRLSPSGNESTIVYGKLKLDTGRGSLAMGEKEVELTKNEIRILAYLIKNQGQTVTREDLIRYLWDAEEFVDDNTLTVNINRVRSKLKEIGAGDMIRTKRGIGYLLG
ncbi:MAG: response regulator transcription factor [Roseburia sp.]|nr:response regulator transcription factor [Roseburia sp.]